MIRRSKSFACRVERLDALFEIAGYSPDEFAVGVGLPWDTISSVVGSSSDVPPEIASRLRAFMGDETYQFVFESSVSLDARLAVYRAPERA